MGCPRSTGPAQHLLPSSTQGCWEPHSGYPTSPGAKSHAQRCGTPVPCLHFSIDLWGSSFPDPPPPGGGTSLDVNNQLLYLLKHSPRPSEGGIMAKGNVSPPFAWGCKRTQLESRCGFAGFVVILCCFKGKKCKAHNPKQSSRRRRRRSRAPRPRRGHTMAGTHACRPFNLSLASLYLYPHAPQRHIFYIKPMDYWLRPLQKEKKKKKRCQGDEPGVAMAFRRRAAGPIPARCELGRRKAPKFNVSAERKGSC